MALGFSTETSSGGDILPIIKYDAKAGDFIRQDRMQDATGQWVKDESEMALPVKVAMDIDALEVGGLTVRHVPKSTKYPAYATLEKYKFQRNLWCGHIHRPDESTIMVKHPVSSWIGGCLCDLKPHYGKLEEISTWQHGITLMTVDMRTGNVSGRNYTFQHNDTHIWCDTVHKTYSVRKQAQAKSEKIA